MRPLLILFCVPTIGLGIESGEVSAQPAAATVVERSTAYHDPLGRWSGAALSLQISESRPDGSEPRLTRLTIDNEMGFFEIHTTREGAEIKGVVSAGDCSLRLRGSTEFSDEEREKYRLTCDHLVWLRNYYTYLWGLPMKLHDPGTRIDPEAVDSWYQQKHVWQVRVTYDESVGSDTWYFYFDQETYALVGYRFYHDEAKGDGEYIVLEGVTESEGLKVPSARAWYTHADDEYLGTDTLVSLETQP